MKRYCLVIAMIQMLTLQAQPPQKETWIKDQNDQTDTLAIPLDSSEEEEKQEMDELQKKKPQNRSQKQ